MKSKKNDLKLKAQEYLKAANSNDWAQLRNLISNQILARLEKLEMRSHCKILDAACGSGWFSDKLSQTFDCVYACDILVDLIEEAKEKFPQINFSACDLNQKTAFESHFFDAIIMNMAAHDVESQNFTFTEFARILKPQGKLILTIMNPFYAFPIGKWKRSWLGKILRLHPRLQLNEYFFYAKGQRKFSYSGPLESYFTQLSEHLNSLIESGFKIIHFQELKAPDSSQFNFNYRNSRFPIILYIEAQKQ